MQFYDRWIDYVRLVARRLAPALTRYGWDGDDAAQQATVKLLRVQNSPKLLALTDEACLMRTLATLTRRSVFRAAGARRDVLRTVEAAILETAEARGDGFVAEFLTGVVADAPPKIREYIQTRIVEGRDWFGTDAVERSARLWVRKQLEVV